MGEMRHLYLLRHAKSSWDDPSRPDHDRPLAERGRRDAAVLSRYAQQHRVEPDLILCSSARRTRETLEGVLPGRTAAVEQELFLADADRLLARLRYVSSEIRSVMLIGHNPALQVLAVRLATTESVGRPSGAEGLEEIKRKLPTGALITLSFEAPWSELGEGPVELVDYVRPKTLQFA